MLENEGILVAIREWITITGQKVTTQDLANAVSEYWRQVAATDRDGRIREESIYQVSETIPALKDIEESTVKKKGLGKGIMQFLLFRF